MPSDNLLLLVQKAVGELVRTVWAAEPRVKVFLFGSRATGQAGVRSDIDVGIDLGHPIPPDVLAAVRDVFDELPILQKVDVVDFSTVDESFKSVALLQTMSLYERQAA